MIRLRPPAVWGGMAAWECAKSRHAQGNGDGWCTKIRLINMPRSAKPARQAVRKPPTKRKAPKAKTAARTKSGSGPLDLSALPPESVSQMERWMCLACVLDVFTRHLGL